MTNRLSQTASPAPVPSTPAFGEPTSIGFAYYRTDHELIFYLRALQRFQSGRLVVVLALKDQQRLSPAEMPTSVRIILTSQGGDLDPSNALGWYVPDPLHAVAVAMTGLQPRDGLILLFPVDWQGDSPDRLVENAKQRISTQTRLNPNLCD